MLGVFNLNVKTKNGGPVEDVAQYIDREDMEVAQSQCHISPDKIYNPYAAYNDKSKPRSARGGQTAGEAKISKVIEAGMFRSALHTNEAMHLSGTQNNDIFNTSRGFCENEEIK